jgi:Sulfotransferase family
MSAQQQQQPYAALPVTDADAGHAEGEKPKVVYVMGAGHSGSTILGLTLGNCSDIFFAGELARWLRWEGKPPLPGAERAQFWSAIRDRVAVTPDLLGRNARPLEQSSALFRVDRWRVQRRLRARYRRVTEELYQAIARAAGVEYVVDTSHFPRRARELQALAGIDLYVLFLVRRPQSVIASYGRKNVPHKQTWDMPTTNAYLWLTYLLSLYVFLCQPRHRRLFVRHETFIADPDGVLQDVLECIGSSARTPDLADLDTGLAFQGNRLLRTPVVALKPHPEDPPSGYRVTALLHLPWAFIFSRLRPAAGRRARPSTRCG